MQNCCICGSADSSPFCCKDSQKYVQCVHCGHVYLPIFSDNYQKTSTTVLPEPVTHHVSDCKQQWDFSSFKREKVFLPRLKTISRYTQPGLLLDIGCANGAFIKAAIGEGWEGCGIELRKSSAQLARSVGLKIYTEPLEKLALAGGVYSAITLWQVLEHLADPQTVLQECNRIMKLGGVLAFSTPNIKSIGWLVLKEYWPAIDPGAHCNLFDSANLERLMNRFGFSKCRIDCLDLQPATLKQFKSRFFTRIPKKYNNATATLISSRSAGQMRLLFILRKALNIPLSAYGLGEDVYGYFQKSSCL
jgi:SAM-dependent methyltransferase